ncbi:hypothetical protein EDC48_12943 [Gibbsiella quercinecans]|nr:hypothetical protein EDC48_12943 [Gibbsiella quercinecans]
MGWGSVSSKASSGWHKPPGNLTTSFDTIKDDSLGEWSTGVEAIEGAERRNVA